MRVVSLVPSWTETLLRAGVHVVGRTRFCLHPREQVKDVPIVGGTKDWKWEKITQLQPDLILLDQEENPKFMAEQTSIPWHATHVTHIEDMPSTLERLSQVVQNESLNGLAERWRSIVTRPRTRLADNVDGFPGVVEWGLKPTRFPKHVLYLIWKNPWMCVSRDTFIGSVLHAVGVQLPLFPKKYPEVDLNQFDPQETLLLLSTEPYPFLKRRQDLAELEFPHAFVDGESFSWFGVRSLEFLERVTAPR
ncbi:MAG: Fe3+-siderophores ABC transporter protein [Bdellovibrionales bacterium]|nr:Fe3+-siderophores ABC transporter protein [Bdellovibrionales bacterium]